MSSEVIYKTGSTYSRCHRASELRPRADVPGGSRLTVRLLQGDCRDVMRQLIAEGVKATEAELAYCAGVIDSDGTIGVKRSTYGMRVTGDSRQPTYSERICVKQVEPHAIDLLHRIFGGRRGMDDPSAKRGKPLFVWQVTDLKAARCLAAILPYLMIKKAQAENCLALRALKERSKRERVAVGRGHVGGASRPAEISTAMEDIYLTAKALNRVGVPEYIDMQQRRIQGDAPLFAEVQTA